MSVRAAPGPGSIACPSGAWPLLLLITTALGLSVDARADLRLEWVARYDAAGGPEPTWDDLASLAVDSQGNAYVTGSAYRTAGRIEPYAVTVKYDPMGRRLWSARYGDLGTYSEQARMLRVDGSRAVYVLMAADLEGSALLVKHDPGGERLWARSYDGEGAVRIDPRALAVDAAGNAYVGGASDPDGSFVAKYDPAGNRLWVARGDMESVSLLDVDRDGNVAAGGSVTEWVDTYDGEPAYVGVPAIVRFEPGGRTLWSERRPLWCNEGASSCGVVAGLQFSPAGELYAGFYSVLHIGYEVWPSKIVRYDSPAQGGREIFFSEEGMGLRLAVTRSSVFMAGAGRTFKYAPVRGYLFRCGLDGGDDLRLEDTDPYCFDPIGIAADDADRVYVTSARGETGVWDGHGHRIGAATYSGPEGGSFQARAMALDGLGNLYVAGNAADAGALQDYALVKYAAEYPEPIIVDDGDPGTIATGAWLVSQGPDPWDGGSLYSSAAGAEYRWKAPVPEAGSYEVFLWWTSWPSRLTAVPVSVRHAFGTTTVSVDQRAGGGRWSSLGVYSFSTDVTVTVRSLGGGSTCADAVRILRIDGPPTPPPLAPIVIDDGSIGTRALGSWAVSGAPLPWGGRSLYSKQAGAEYRFETPLPEPGAWEVFLWWTAWPSRLAAVPVVIEHASGFSTVQVDQLANGGAWNSLGVFSFGSDATVRVRSLGIGSTCADAVRLVRVPDSQPPPPQPVIVDDGGPGTSRVGYWPVSGAPAPWGPTSVYSKEPGAEYRFEASLPRSGSFEVFVWWTSYPSRLAAVPVVVHGASGQTTVLVNQLSGGGRWSSVGIHELGASGKVVIRSLGGGSTCADAVSFVPR